jgi:hypothetical protein
VSIKWALSQASPSLVLCLGTRQRLGVSFIVNFDYICVAVSHVAGNLLVLQVISNIYCSSVRQNLHLICEPNRTLECCWILWCKWFWCVCCVCILATVRWLWCIFLMCLSTSFVMFLIFFLITDAYSATKSTVVTVPSSWGSVFGSLKNTFHKTQSASQNCWESKGSLPSWSENLLPNFVLVVETFM